VTRTKVNFDDFNACFFKVFIQTDLFGCHRLGFDNGFYAMLFGDIGDNLEVTLLNTAIQR